MTDLALLVIAGALHDCLHTGPCGCVPGPVSMHDARKVLHAIDAAGLAVVPVEQKAVTT